jgi:iron complex transport system ATP-binding protein
VTLHARQVSFRVGSLVLLDQVSLELKPGCVHALLGPNGAGKSTLLRTLAGDLRPVSGSVTLGGRPLMEWNARDRARQRAVLLQQDSLQFAFTAREVVALGRLPCPTQGPEREKQIVDEALAIADAAHLADRVYPTLSSGERSRVQFARAAAQIWEPLTDVLGGSARYLLLDEPTANLDLSHQHSCLQIARRLAADGVAVLTVLHDPNLAMAYADEVSLLRGGRLLASGAPLQVLTAAHLESLYGLPVRLWHPPGSDRPILWTPSVKKP